MGTLLKASTEDLRSAYTRSGLYRLGWTFERAMQATVIRKALTGLTVAMHRRQAEKPSPSEQPQLF